MLSGHDIVKCCGQTVRGWATLHHATDDARRPPNSSRMSALSAAISVRVSVLSPAISTRRAAKSSRHGVISCFRTMPLGTRSSEEPEVVRQLRAQGVDSRWRLAAAITPEAPSRRQPFPARPSGWRGRYLRPTHTCHHTPLQGHADEPPPPHPASSPRAARPSVSGKPALDARMGRGGDETNGTTAVVTSSGHYIETLPPTGRGFRRRLGPAG